MIVASVIAASTPTAPKQVVGQFEITDCGGIDSKTRIATCF